MKKVSQLPTKVWFDKKNIFIETKEGEIKSHPLRWFPALEKASKKEKNMYRISPGGLHWQELDLDLSFDGFFTYNKDVLEEEKNEVEKVFKTFPELSITEFARRNGISSAVMRHYSCGIKNPSKQRKKEIEKALHNLGKKLLQVELK